MKDSMIDIGTVASELGITEPRILMMAGRYAVAAYHRKYKKEPEKDGWRVYPIEEHDLLVEALHLVSEWDFITVASVMSESAHDFDNHWLCRAGLLAAKKYKTLHGRKPPTGPFPFARVRIYEEADREIVIEALRETKDGMPKQPKKPKQQPVKPKSTQPTGYSSLASWQKAQ